MHHTLVRSLSVFSGNSLQKPRASVRFAGCSSYRPAYFGGLVYYPIGARHAFYTFAPSTPFTCPDAHSPTRPRITHSSLFRIMIAHGRDIKVDEGSMCATLQACRYQSVQFGTTHRSGTPRVSLDT